MSAGGHPVSGAALIQRKCESNWFDGRIAIELPLSEALERSLLCPFHYFTLHDNTDLPHATWSRRGYDVAELEDLYTGNHARASLVAQTIQDQSCGVPQRH